MATPSTLTQATIGLYVLLALIVGAVAFISGILAHANALTWGTEGIVVSTLILAIFAAFEQYESSGGLPGPKVSVSFIVGLVLTYLYTNASSLVSGPVTDLGILAFCLGLLKFLQAEVAAMASQSTGGSSSTGTTPPPSTPKA